jgi:lipopolysaccharide transport system ATP-binding protein
MAKAIVVENVSKQYRLGQIGTGALTHDINRWWHKVRGKDDPYLKIGEANDRSTKGSSEYVWSLRDINFEIQQGDSVGIIGRNGAGKSTLLKILSRVTAPTTGSLKVKGRIASLLEVGTGFHPELSGRDNIFLNGAILGMRKHEIKKKFDEIVDFAGVERYIDTPVKRYSSGMYVRLAFAVAAHLESEIMIVDEVLAVGDIEFQKKCIGKMGEVSQGEGRTILFVSHNMNSINQLCNRAILLRNGELDFVGKTSDCIYRYNSQGENFLEKTFWVNESSQFKDEYFSILKAELVDRNLNKISTSVVNRQDQLSLIIEGQIQTFNKALKIGYELLDENGNLLFTSLSTDNDPHSWPELKIGKNMLVTNIPTRLLKPGNYTVSIHISLHLQRWVCNAKNNDVSLGFTIAHTEDFSPYFENGSGMISVPTELSQFRVNQKSILITDC